MREYTTQMDAAKKGIITREMEIVANKESKNPEEIRSLVAEGKVAIPANINHKSLSPEGVGQGLKTKINVNLGISKDCCDCDRELEKISKEECDKILDVDSFEVKGNLHDLYELEKAYPKNIKIKEENNEINTI